MWIYFDNNGEERFQIQHGVPARVGQIGDFNIFAYFEDIDLDEYSFATLSLRAPSGDVVSNFGLIGNRETMIYNRTNDESDINPFDDGSVYEGYNFRLDLPLLTQEGKWNGTIALYKNNVVKVNSQFTFNVEGATVDLDELVSVNNLNALISSLQYSLHKNDNFYFRVLTKKWYEAITINNVTNINNGEDASPYNLDTLKLYLSETYCYAFVTQDKKIYRVSYVPEFNGFKYEELKVDLSSINLTVPQLNAINSGINSSMVSKINSIPTSNYSTTEIDTGKKWVDGRKIYSRTYYVSSLNYNSQHSFPLYPNQVTNMFGTFKNLSGETRCINAINTTIAGDVLNAYINNSGYLVLKPGTNTVSSIYITIEYTK